LPKAPGPLAATTPKLAALTGRPASKKLDDIKANPRGDWTIADIKAACKQLGLECTPPTRGSHHKVSSARLMGHLTVPYNRPIKVIYIRQFIALAEAHIKVASLSGGENV